MNDVFTILRRKTVLYLEKAKKTNSVELKFDLMSLAMVYDGILESLDDLDIRNSQLLRQLRILTNNKIVDIEELAKCSLIGMKEEIVKIYGGKAWGLAVLSANGETIPLTNAISTLESEATPLFVSEKYSVRSSADIEDGNKYSFAGMFDSYLDVDIKAISDTIKLVKNSVNNERVKAYIKLHSLSIPKMGVIIQSFIEPEISGVWIGDSIETGYLEYVHGSGDKLVSGQVTPSHEDWISTATNDDYLKTALNEKVGEHMINLQKRLGCPGDFEWCIINGKIVMLQFRPVTAKLNVVKEKNNKFVDESELLFKGIAASPGECCGEATYIRLIKEFDASTWNDGNILMAWFTDPKWMHILTKCSRVVTAVDGFLCHTAIIARELGIPCVIGIGQNMKKIWSEKVIRIDGTNEYVSVPDKF